VPESRAELPAAIDVIGLTLVTLSLTALVLPLIEGRQFGWPAWAQASLALSPVLIWLTVRHQKRMLNSGRRPLLDVSLFQVRSLQAGLLSQLVFWCTQASFYLVLALYLQQGRGMSALHAGLVFAILAAAYLAVSLRAPALTLRFGRSVIMVGALTEAVGLLLLIVAVTEVGITGPTWSLAPGLVLIGIGQGLCITPLTTTVLTHTDPQRAGAVSGALSTMQQVGNCLGVAITGLIFFNALDHGYATAFRYSLAELTILVLAVNALALTLPRPQPASR
jgi:Na+/melibiose symporter-like transporter